MSLTKLHQIVKLQCVQQEKLGENKCVRVWEKPVEDFQLLLIVGLLTGSHCFVSKLKLSVYIAGQKGFVHVFPVPSSTKLIAQGLAALAG